MSITSKLKSLAVNPEGFAFDPASGDSYQLNETGIFITKHLQLSLDPDQIMDKLATEFDVEPEVAQRDVDDFINRLRVNKLA